MKLQLEVLRQIYNQNELTQDLSNALTCSVRLISILSLVNASS